MVTSVDAAVPAAVEEFRFVSDRSTWALTLAQAGRHEEAGQAMAEALAVTPDSAWAHLRQARLHLLRGDVVAMGAALRRAMETSEQPMTQSQRAMAEALLRLG